MDKFYKIYINELRRVFSWKMCLCGLKDESVEKLSLNLNPKQCETF